MAVVTWLVNFACNRDCSCLDVDCDLADSCLAVDFDLCDSCLGADLDHVDSCLGIDHAILNPQNVAQTIVLLY